MKALLWKVLSQVTPGLLIAFNLYIWAAGPAHAGGLLYRDAATGRWVKIAAEGDIVAGGALAGRTFATVYRPSVDVYVGGGSCGGATVQLTAFEASVDGDDPDRGLFLYDVSSGTLIDVAIEDAAAPIGGTWSAFLNPKVVIDTSAACTAHVIFVGLTDSPDGEGLFDAAFSIPALTPLGTTVLAEAGVTVPPGPFPVASTFYKFRGELGARQPVAGTIVLAFRAEARHGGVTNDDDSGVFAGVLGSTLSTVAREGVSCGTPGWAGAGPAYGEFDDHLQVDVVGLTPAAVYRALSVDGPSSDTDTAIELSTGCSLATVIAAEGGATPIGGTYDHFDGDAAVAASSARLAFAAKVEGLGDIKRAIFHGVGAPPIGAVARVSLPDTSIGNVSIVYEGDPLAVNDVAGDVVFSARVDGYGKPGLFLFSYGSVVPAELTTFLGEAPSIDSVGNMAAIF
jgi:hypothetical protein